MGNSNQGRFESRDWVLDHRSHNYDIYHDQRGTYAEKHIVPNNPKVDHDDEIQIYNYRHDTDKPIVRVYQAEYTKAGSMCKAEPEIQVFTQYIPYRLSDTRNLNNGQALYVLSEALAGFHQLYYRFGPFTITDDHIGFNDQGDAKVWLTPNFASNHLPHDGIILMSTQNPKNFDEKMQKRQQEEMVEDIWLAVDDHALIDNDFRQRANNFREMNFVQARRLVASQIERGACYVPQYLNFENTRRFEPMIDSRQFKQSSGSYHSHSQDFHQPQYESNYYQNNQYLQTAPQQGGISSGVQPYQSGNFNQRFNDYPPTHTY